MCVEVAVVVAARVKFNIDTLGGLPQNSGPSGGKYIIYSFL